MNWKPNTQERKYLETLIEGAHAAINGEGAADRQTFCNDLRVMARAIDELPGCCGEKPAATADLTGA